MAKPRIASGHTLTLRYTTQVNVGVPEFQLLSSVKYLDAETLGRASKAKIEVGFFKTPCCAGLPKQHESSMCALRIS